MFVWPAASDPGPWDEFQYLHEAYGNVYGICMTSVWNLEEVYVKSRRGRCEVYMKPNEGYVRSTEGLYEVYMKSIYEFSKTSMWSLCDVYMK